MALTVMDDRGRELSLTDEPSRVVSLVPSDSYNLVKLGVGDRLVGRTDYCVEPAAELAAVASVGGTKNPDVDRLLALQPDLVVANREENRRVDVERLETAGVTVLLSFPRTVRQGLEQVARLAQLWPSRDAHQQPLLNAARAQLGDLPRQTGAPLATFVAIWLDPLMTVNGDTFTSDMIELCGGRNVMSQRDLRYPRVTFDEVAACAPQLVLLPDEPYAFGPEHVERFASLGADGGATQVRLWDGRDLTWYGLRCLAGLQRLADCFAQLRGAGGVVPGS